MAHVKNQDQSSEIARTALATHRSERDALLERITRTLKADERIVALWLFGSLGSGGGDDLSDLDLFVAVEDSHFGAVAGTLGAHRAFATEAGGITPVVLGEAPQNAPPGGAYLGALYAGAVGPHRVDWYWQNRSMARIPAGEARVLFDRANLPRIEEPLRWDYQPAPEPTPEELAARRCGGVWGMLCITAKYVARSPHEEGMGLLRWVCEPLNDLAQYIGGEEVVEHGNAATLTAPTDKIALLRRLAKRMEALTPMLAARGVAVPSVAAAEQAYRYLEMIEAVASLDVSR